MPEKRRATARPFGHSMRKDTETRMAQALAPRLSTLLGTAIQWSDIKLYPARGYWTQKRADVQAFTGSFKFGNINYSLGCWESMTECLRKGFEVADSRSGMLRGGKYSRATAYAHFEIWAKE